MSWPPMFIWQFASAWAAHADWTARQKAAVIELARAANAGKATEPPTKPRLRLVVNND